MHHHFVYLLVFCTWYVAPPGWATALDRLILYPVPGILLLLSFFKLVAAEKIQDCLVPVHVYYLLVQRARIAHDMLLTAEMGCRLR